MPNSNETFTAAPFVVTLPLTVAELVVMPLAPPVAGVSGW